MYRHTYMRIDIDAMLKNIEYLAKINKKGVIPVIKANAYGTYDIYVAKVLREHGYGLLAVSSLDEALNLRLSGDRGDILILGYVKREDFNLLKRYDLTVITFDYDIFDALDEKILNGLKVHLKVESGMHRLGVESDKLLKLDAYLRSKGAKVEGIMTHFACSDDPLELNNDRQFATFKNTLAKINHPFKYIHCANTDAAINYHDDLSNYIRIGLGMWGFSSFASDLKPAISFYTSISHIQKVPKGEGVGYGLRYISDGKGYIAVLPVGYADGLWRSNSGRRVYINGKYCSLVGNLCMDQCFVKIDELWPLETEVEIFGEHLPLPRMAKELNTIPYEIITNIGNRVSRVFVDEKGEELFVYNERFKDNYGLKN